MSLLKARTLFVLLWAFVWCDKSTGYINKLNKVADLVVETRSGLSTADTVRLEAYADTHNSQILDNEYKISDCIAHQSNLSIPLIYSLF